MTARHSIAIQTIGVLSVINFVSAGNSAPNAEKVAENWLITNPEFTLKKITHNVRLMLAK